MQASAIVLQQQPRGWKVYEFGDMQKCLICYPGAPGIGFSAISCWVLLLASPLVTRLRSVPETPGRTSGRRRTYDTMTEVSSC